MKDVQLLALFPELDCLGGVQASGRLALEGLLSLEQTAHGFRCHRFFYGKGNVDEVAREERSTIATTKLRALGASLLNSWEAGTVLVWHLGLLKLLPLLRLPNARVVVFLHGIESWKPMNWLMRTQLRRVSIFLCNSEYTWCRFIENNPEFRGHKYRVVPLGLGTIVSDPVSDPSVPPASLMIGRLDKNESYKGHHEVISAWTQVLRVHPGAELWLVGDGDLKFELQKQAAASKGCRQIRFYGTVSEATKEELLNQCTCLALPSRAEGFGLVYLEAMRFGRPCLVSTIDAGREVVNPPEAGLAADPDQSSQLVSTLCKLLARDSDWTMWSRQARLRYGRSFTAKHFQDRLLSALLEWERAWVTEPLSRRI